MQEKYSQQREEFISEGRKANQRLATEIKRKQSSYLVKVFYRLRQAVSSNKKSSL